MDNKWRVTEILRSFIFLLDSSYYASIPHCVDWSPLDHHLLAVGKYQNVLITSQAFWFILLLNLLSVVLIYIFIFLGYEDGSVCLCNIQNPKQPVLTYCHHERAVNKLAFSPRRLVLVRWEKREKVMNTSFTSKLLWKKGLLESEKVNHVCVGCKAEAWKYEACIFRWHWLLHWHTVFLVYTLLNENIIKPKLNPVGGVNSRLGLGDNLAMPCVVHLKESGWDCASLYRVSSALRLSSY